MSILLRIVPPYLIRWCNLLAGRAVGQPHSTIQKKCNKIWLFQKIYIYLHRQTKIIKNMNQVSVKNYRGREIGAIEYCSLSELKDLFADYIVGKVFESSDCLKMTSSTLLELKSVVCRHSFLRNNFRVLVF